MMAALAKVLSRSTGEGRRNPRPALDLLAQCPPCHLRSSEVEGRALVDRGWASPTD
jgi:hypothetical protein